MPHPFLDLADIVTRIRGQNIHKKLREKDQDISAGHLDVARKRLEDIKRVHKAQFGGFEKVPAGAKDMGYSAEVFKPGTEQRRLDIAQGYLDLGRQKQAGEEQTYLYKWNKFMSGAPKPVRLIGLAEQEPAFKPVVNSILDKMGTGEIKTRSDAYQYLKQSEAILIKRAREDLTKDIEKLIKEGKYNEADVKGQLLNQMRPGFLEDFFGFPENLKPKRPGDVDLDFPSIDLARARTSGPAVAVDTFRDAEGNLWQVDSRGFLRKKEGGPDPRVTAAQVADMEAKIEIGRVNDKIPSSALSGAVAYVNQYSERPFIYVPGIIKVPGALYGHNEKESYVKIPLPKFKGQQLTAKWIIEKAKHDKVDYLEVLRALGIDIDNATETIE